MVSINTIHISPSLLNSSCAWSSDLGNLQELYASPYTGAITTRTATLNGFKEDQTHKVAFAANTVSTINSYGYSPHPLSDYLEWVETILLGDGPNPQKPIIISITAPTAEELQVMVAAIQDLRDKLKDKGTVSRIAIELNTSCPNILKASPSGYSFPSLVPLLRVLVDAFFKDKSFTIGLKLPPYTYKEQYVQVLETLKGHATSDYPLPISFLTCTNTLGSSLLYPGQILSPGDADAVYAVPTGLGGLAGELLHPLALGNVFSFANLLRGAKARFPELSSLKIIGVGGVTSKEAAKRMRDAGADAIGCATLYGREGVKAFEILST
ncbi:FMN-linked oxidoreductase [Coprinopsis marcescibilis]|uniref:Dihydroorotate oxidase n=1 Tax=Coprinopsis marcescibilis TaxID=230819 RepID=A0A5C3LEW5_COPMA|nr:FMN-linked oxidoreductase [Coprinopsis marcescibilis]